LAWAFYDTDDDSKFDLVLVADGRVSDAPYVTQAFRLSADGALSPAPGHVGRRLLRAGLLSSPRAASALRAARRQMDAPYAEDEGPGSLPDPLLKGNYPSFREVKGFPRGAIVSSSTRSTEEGMRASTTWIDLKLRVPVPAKTGADKIVGDAKFHPTIAVVSRGELSWVYYDTDGDGRFDLVLFSTKGGSDPVHAYRLKHPPPKQSGAVTVEADAGAVPGRLYRHHSVFKDKALAARWKTLASQLFAPKSVEE
jgi:hypothetical protein